MGRLLTGLLLLTLLGGSASAWAQDGAGALDDGSPAPVFTEPPRVEVLDNGLHVVTLRFPSPSIIAYYTLVRVGSRDEVEPGHSGYAHLFEHMMFRGTPTTPQPEYERAIQRFGADNNAFTSQDFTLYTVTAPSAVLPDLVMLEADRFMHLAYDEAAYRIETGAVAGEYETSAANPLMRMWESLSETAFTRHTYGHTTLGYLRDIESMPGEVAYSRAFLGRFYTPDNTTLIVVGDVDHDALMPLVRARYGAWRGRRARVSIPREPAITQSRRVDLDWASEAAPRMLVGYRVPAFASGRSEAQRARALRETAALQVAHGLAFSNSSPLYQRLVVEQARLLSLSSWAGEFTRDPHLFIVQATLTEGQSFDALMSEVQAELDSIGQGSIAMERIEAVKSALRYELMTGVETASDAAGLVARFWAVSGGSTSLEAYLRALADLEPEEIAAAARRYLGENSRTLITLSHHEGGAESEGAESEGDSE